MALSCASAAAAEPEAEARDLPRVPPTEPAQALATFKIKPGFRLELVAAEPEVIDPVALSFDENGRMFVIEMRDYSEQRDHRLGRVRLLEDKNNDGRFEASTVFADDLPWPTAVICYGGGVFVAASPDLLFLKDTNGDGRADEKRVVFTGFAKGVERLNVQALPNSFNWSLDNRIHGATGPNGGSITRPDAPQLPAVDLRGRDFSFDPRTLDFRAETGGSQHGMSFDNAGRKFVCSNSSHIQTLMYEERYAARNRVYSLPKALLDIAVDGGAAPVYRISPDEPWRVIRTQWRVAGKVPGPIEGGGRPSGYFTSATGVTIYRGDAFGPEFVGDAFIGDCGSNLVHRKKIRPAGVGLNAERPEDEQKTEFLASTDNWFRPVQFANAPDGCLYVLDMYREVIEHPWSLPPGIKKHVDLNSGNDRGRIYRIIPGNHSRRAAARLEETSTTELIRLLEHRNGWHRDTAARRLYERQDKAAVSAIRNLLRNSAHEVGRLHALYALVGLAALRPEDIEHAMRDPSAVLREHAVRLSESLPALPEKLVQLVDDPAPRVRYQLAFTLGQMTNKAGPLAKILIRDGGDSWISAAALSSLDTQNDDGTNAGKVFEMLPDVRLPVSDLASLIGAQGNTSVIRIVIESTKKTNAETLGIVSSLAKGLKRSQTQLADVAPPDWLKHIATQAATVATDTNKFMGRRLAAVGLLGSLDYTTAKPVLVSLLKSDARELHALAGRSLAQFRDQNLPQTVLPLWNELSPPARSELVSALLSRTPWVYAVLDAIEAGQLDKSVLNAQQRQSLVNHSDRTIYERARKLFNVTTNSERETIIEQFMAATRMTGDAKAGRPIYQERCASCHRIGSEGHAVGPDLVTMKASGKEKMLVNIIDPNREVAPNFQSYAVETTDGDIVTGLLVRDAGGSVTLTSGGGTEMTLIRAQVRKLSPQDKSVMPEGLEAALSVHQMADLLEYLSTVE